jgi:uncharacterized protein (TIGR00251 family)
VSAPEPIQTIAGEDRACILTVRAQPGASKNAAVGSWNGLLKLAVTAPPEDGRANRALVDLVAELFDLRPAAVTLVGGETSRIKRLRLAAHPDRIRARLSELLA